jgi:hypothetical protein
VALSTGVSTKKAKPATTLDVHISPRRDRERSGYVWFQTFSVGDPYGTCKPSWFLSSYPLLASLGSHWCGVDHLEFFFYFGLRRVTRLCGSWRSPRLSYRLRRLEGFFHVVNRNHASMVSHIDGFFGF